MPFENGVNWRPVDPDKRGRHRTTASALEVAFRDLMADHDPFFDSLADRWDSLFPGLPARPGRYEDGMIFLYAPDASQAFFVRPRLRAIAARLASLPGAPRRPVVKLEVRAS